jgi:FkbM family methyltransferase
LDPGEAVDGNLIFCPQLYDTAEIHFLLTHLADEDTFVDIGSHKGFYSLMASRRITRGRILAVEADPQTFASLRRNIELNHLAVTAVHCGVSDREEMLPLNVQVSGNRSGSSFLGTSELQVTVACRPLAKIVDDTGLLRITCMKLDIEGFEHKVLKSFFEQANPDLHPRYIITELHPDPSLRTGDLLGLLAAREYEEILRTGLNRIFRLRDRTARA